MRVLILHADDGKIQKSVVALQGALEQGGVKVDLVSPEVAAGSPVSAAPYGLVCVVTGYTGWWKPQLPVEMDSLLKKVMRLEGKKGGAFVRPGILGSAKALRVLMGHMERQGVIVEDFGTIGGEQEAVSIAKRLQRLV
ncbi:MAG TPA: hypothetical protein DDZ66_04705 [Firmicutes bacterium]|nr:hypothetical protein [Bacillota bacterium]